jgi:3-hydroxyacyl-[acyl-carrier-protein] dehydratase
VDFTADGILITGDHPCFEGHFPGHPIFPAVAQIDLVLVLLQERWRQDLLIVEIRKAKFPAPLLPDAIVSISVKIQDRTVFWHMLGNGKTCSSGTLLVDFGST